MMKKYRSRAPLRLGLAGGGSDVSPFCDLYGGQVLNATINHYAHCTIEPLATGEIIFNALDIGIEEKHDKTSIINSEKGLRLHRDVYNLIVERYNDGKPLSLRMITHLDAPPGSGLGSSSTLAVAMVQAYLEWLKLPLGEYDVARVAFEVERIRLGQAGGRQDQYAAAFGGVNFIEFHTNERVIVNPLRIKPWILNEFESSIVLFYSTISRFSSDIINEQISMVKSQNQSALAGTNRLKEDAIRMKEALLKGDIGKIGVILKESWEAKKMLASTITNPELDETMKAAMASGAVAGKVSGAGGGGFIMLITDPESRVKLERVLAQRKGYLLPFRFSLEGAESWSVKR